MNHLFHHDLLKEMGIEKEHIIYDVLKHELQFEEEFTLFAI